MFYAIKARLLGWLLGQPRQVLIDLVYAIVKRLTDKDLWKAIQGLVRSYADRNMKGENKRKAVIRELSSAGSDVYKLAEDAGGTLVNLAIEAAVLELKGAIDRKID